MAAKAPVMDDTATELDSINELLDAEQRKREKAEARAPRGFDPACLFLLGIGYENLFDPAGSDEAFRCRGCGEPVKRWQREKHWSKHKRAVERGELKAKEEHVSKGATQDARAQREARAASQGRTAAVSGKASNAPAKTANGAEKPAEKPAAAKASGGGWRPSNTDASQAILGKLGERLAKKLPKAAVLELKANDKVGYTSIKVNDKLIGYGWLTNKEQLRVEVAIETHEAPPGIEVLECKRSATMRSRTVIKDSGPEYDLAVAMLLTAARKWSGVK